MKRQNDWMIRETLRIMACGKLITELDESLGERKFMIDGLTIHIKGDSSKANGIYPFNINPNMYGVEVNVLTCGRPDEFYTLPNTMIQTLDKHPDKITEKKGGRRTIIHINDRNRTIGFPSRPLFDIDRYFHVTVEEWNQRFVEGATRTGQHLP